MCTICSLIITILISELAGYIGHIFAAPSLFSWYAQLYKPEYSPPGWLFIPVWITLYFLMGMAAHLVWMHKNEKPKETKKAIIIYYIQLTLSILFPIVFFGMHLVGWAFLELIILCLFILWTILEFYKISRTAAYLLLPYLLFASYAGCCFFKVWMLNRPL